MYRIPHCKALHLIVGSPGAIIALSTDDLLSFAIQYDKPSCSYSILCSHIELHMHHLPWCKAHFGRVVRWLLEHRLLRCHVVQQLVHRPFLQGWCQLLVHLQLLWSNAVLVNQQLRLVLHEVDEQSLQLRVCIVNHL